MTQHHSHPDLDTLSASLDTQSEKVAEHVAGCAACRARVDGLAAAREAVAQPVPPVPAEVRERVIAEALAAFGTGVERAGVESPPAPAPDPVVRSLPLRVPPAPEPASPRQPDRPDRRWWLGGSAAAAVLALVIGAATLFGGGGTDHNTDTALSAGPSAREKSASEAAVTDAGDLGDVASVDVLRSRVAPVAGSGQAAVALAPAAGATAASPAAGSSAAASGDAAAVPRQIGTRVCEIEARTVRPQVGVVVYAASARFQGTPAVVLGFAPTPGAPPSVLLVLAQPGCRVLAETTL